MIKAASDKIISQSIFSKCPGCEIEFEESWEVHYTECPECETLLNLFEVTTKTVREVKAIKNEPR